MTRSRKTIMVRNLHGEWVRIFKKEGKVHILQQGNIPFNYVIDPAVPENVIVMIAEQPGGTTQIAASILERAMRRSIMQGRNNRGL